MFGYLLVRCGCQKMAILVDGGRYDGSKRQEGLCAEGKYLKRRMFLEGGCGLEIQLSGTARELLAS
jgi:hypothetical protein